MNMTLEVTLRLFVALLLGGIVGIEREFRSKDAGFRTHFSSRWQCPLLRRFAVRIWHRSERFVAGGRAGCLGNRIPRRWNHHLSEKYGTRTYDSSRTVVTAAIGLACGTGMYAASTIATVMILLGLEVLNALIPQVGTTTVSLTFSATSKESVKEWSIRSGTTVSSCIPTN